MTASDYEKMRSEVERYYAKQMLDSLTFSSARRALEECPPTISGKALKNLLQWLSDAAVQSQHVGVRPGVSEDSRLQRSPPSTILAANHWSHRHATGYDTGICALVFARQVSLDFSRPTSSTLRTVKDLIFRMVRDKRLIKIARSRGYGADPNVQFEMSLWNDKLSYWKQKAAVLEGTCTSRKRCQDFYAEHEYRYASNPAGLPLTFDQAKGRVKVDMVLYEYNKQLSHYLNAVEAEILRFRWMKLSSSLFTFPTRVFPGK